MNDDETPADRLRDLARLLRGNAAYAGILVPGSKVSLGILARSPELSRVVGEFDLEPFLDDLEAVLVPETVQEKP